MKEIDVKFTRSHLLEINRKIKSLCDNHLEIAIYTDVKNNNALTNVSLYDDTSNPDFVICLNYSIFGKIDCMSSISCKINDDLSLEFSSKTDPMYEGNKYNLLLRSILIILCPFIKIKTPDSYKYDVINMIVSRAINPISIYLLAKYFHAYNDLLETYMTENDLEYDDLTFDNIKDFYDNLDPMMNLDDEEMEQYMKNNSDFGNPILLTIDPNNQDNIKQATKIFKNIAIKCPKIGGRTKRLKKPKQKRKKNKRHKSTLKIK